MTVLGLHTALVPTVGPQTPKTKSGGPDPPTLLWLGLWKASLNAPRLFGAGA